MALILVGLCKIPSGIGGYDNSEIYKMKDMARIKIRYPYKHNMNPYLLVKQFDTPIIDLFR